MKVLALMLVIVAAVTAPLCAAPRVALVIDRSGSMEGEKLQHLKEGAKLAVGILDGELVVIAFDDEVMQSPRFGLQTAKDRRTAMAWIDGLDTGGGTNTLSALEALRRLPHGTPAILISDGENTEGSAADVVEAAKNAPGPVFTVAVDAPKEAQELLNKVAAATGGAAAQIDRAEDLVTVLVTIGQALADYRSFAPQQETLKFPNSRGRVIALGYAALPNIESKPNLPLPPFQHRARLPGEEVVLARVTLEEASDIVIRALHKDSDEGRLAKILRNDLPQARLGIASADGKVPAGGTLEVITEFFDPATGKQIDPRERDDLLAGYLLQQDGETIARIRATPLGDKPALGATIQLPDQSGALTIVQVTRDSSTGFPFDARHEQTVIAEEPLAVSARPAIIRATGRAGIITATVDMLLPPKMPDGTSFEVRLLGGASDVRLAKTTVTGHSIHLDFECGKIGPHAGSLRITTKAKRPVLPLDVPFELVVKPPLLGLAVEKVELGEVVSGSGRQVLGPVTVASRDEEAAAYDVVVGDLSNGQNVISLTSDPETISPSEGSSATFNLVADVPAISAGTYTSSIAYVLRDGGEARRWESELSLRVAEQFKAPVADFGSVASGDVIERTIPITNRGVSERDVSLSAAPIDTKGGATVLTVPDEMSLVVGETLLVAKLAISPLVTARGEVTTQITLSDAGETVVRVPVRLLLIDPASVDWFDVTPSEFRLTGRPGDVIRFEAALKPLRAAVMDQDVAVQAAAFRGDAGLARVTTSFTFPEGQTLQEDRSLVVNGFLVAPLRRGTYRGEIVFSSGANTRKIPLNLTVEGDK